MIDETPQVAPILLSNKTSRSWYVEEVQRLFCSDDSPATTEDYESWAKKHRMLDFIISPGRISAKILENNSTPQKVEMVIGEFDENIWQDFFNHAAKHAYIMAKMLAGELCSEVNTILAELGVSLIPAAQQQVQCFLNNAPVASNHRFIVSLSMRFASRLAEDPFALFVLRGCGHEELLNNLRKSRRQLKPENLPYESNNSEPVISNETLDFKHSLSRETYWASGPELDQLSFSIKADELPAAILKWLDPLPLNGYEEEIERTLEECYAQVACRAHAFGLGL